MFGTISVLFLQNCEQTVIGCEPEDLGAKGPRTNVRIVVQFSSVAQSYPTLCDPMDGHTPGFPVHHQLPELT